MPSKSPVEQALMSCSATRWASPASTLERPASVGLMVRRARLASWRQAAGLRPRISLIASKE